MHGASEACKEKSKKEKKSLSAPPPPDKILATPMQYNNASFTKHPYYASSPSSRRQPSEKIELPVTCDFQNSIPALMKSDKNYSLAGRAQWEPQTAYWLHHLFTQSSMHVMPVHVQTFVVSDLQPVVNTYDLEMQDANISSDLSHVSNELFYGLLITLPAAY